MVFKTDQVNEIIQRIQQIKRKDEQLQLLAEVYAFMVDQRFVCFLVFVL